MRHSLVSVVRCGLCILWSAASRACMYQPLLLFQRTVISGGYPASECWNESPLPSAHYSVCACAVCLGLWRDDS